MAEPTVPIVEPIIPIIKPTIPVVILTVKPIVLSTEPAAEFSHIIVSKAVSKGQTVLLALLYYKKQ